MLSYRYLPMRRGTFRWGSPFGMRDGSPHRGQDFEANDGTPIYAAQAGNVVYIGAAQGFGQWIVIDHPQDAGAGTTVYGHMWNAFATGLKAGDWVRAGQLIGYVGSNGQSTGPHLHFEVHPTVWRQGSQVDPAPWLKDASDPGAPVQPPAPKPPVTTPIGETVLKDPFTGAIWSPSFHPRRLGVPGWIGVHTQEGGRRAVDLGMYLKNPANEVSYHSVNDDIDVLKIVAESNSPWAAASANDYAFHHCFAGSYASWSRNKWLDPDASDGKNEDLQLTLGAGVVAWWCDKYGIPATWIGGRNVPPWGLRGVCGHADFGAWGGGHHDPGVNFPAEEFMRRVVATLTGKEQPPVVLPPPVVKPGTNPDKYADYDSRPLYRGGRWNDMERVLRLQHRLKYAYAAYAGHLVEDGDFGPLTDLAVREFQRRSGLVSDGIVGPSTASAMKL